MEKVLGKIRSVGFGFGGYQDCMLGLSLSFEMKSGCVDTFISGGWMLERDKNAKWTELDRANQQSDLCQKLIYILKQAKVDDVSKLKGKPVEVTLEGMVLKDWRILDEVL